MSLVRCAAVLWAVTSLAHSLGAQEKVTDIHGDPLPPGAIGRLGKLAFRVTTPVSAARYLDGGKLLVKTRDADYRIDGVFQLFDAQSGKELNRIIGAETAEQRALREEDRYYSYPEWCLSPNGKWLARVDPIATKSTTRFQWQEVATGKIVGTIEAAHCAFHRPRFSPDNKYFAVIAAQTPANPKDEKKYDKEPDKETPAVIRMWDVATRREVRTFALPPQSKETFRPRRFAFSPDGAYLAASGFGGGKNGVVRVWGVAGEKPSWSLTGQQDDRDCPTPFAFAPDGRTIAALHDGKLGTWDTATGNQVKVVADYDERCCMLDFSPDGSRLLACKAFDINRRGPKQIQMWDANTGKEFDVPVEQPQGFVFSRSGDTLIVAAAAADRNQGSIHICDGATGQARHAIRVEVAIAHPERDWQGLGWPFALSPDGRTLVFADKAGQVQHFSIATGKALAAPGIATDVAEALAFSPDGKKLLAAGKTRVLLHEVDGSKPSLPLRLNPLENALVRDFHSTPRVEVGNRSYPNANCVALASDGQRAAAGWTNGLVSVWDTASGKLLWQARVVDLPIHCVTFAADDQTVISSGLNGQIVWWDAATGRIRRKLERVPGKEFDNHVSLPFRFSPGGQTAFGMSPDSEALEEWELSSGKVRRALNVLPYPVDFSRDGRSLLVIGENAYHSVDLHTGRPLRSFAWAEYPQPETNPYGWCRFSPDGGTVAGLVNHKIVRFWDAHTATLLASLSDRAGFTTLAFAPDGKTLATANGDGTILLWRTPPRSVPAAAANARKPVTELAAAKEADGAALPAGARARLGLLRFQHGDNVYALRYAADGRSILAATDSSDSHWESDISLALWNSATGKLERRTHVLHENHFLLQSGWRGPPRQGWHLSPNGELLATFNIPVRKNGGTVYSPLVVRELDTDKSLVEIHDETFLQFSPDSKLVATLLDDSVKLYDLVAGKVRHVIPVEEKFRVDGASFSPDGQLLVMIGHVAEAWEIRWYHLGRGGVVTALPHRPFTKEMNPYTDRYPGGIIVAPDSRHLALVSKLPQHQSPHLIVVEIESGKVVRDFGERPIQSHRLLFSPDGNQLTSLVSDKLERWEVKTGKKLPPVSGLKDAVIQFAPDGKTLAVADGDVLRLLDAATAEERCRMPSVPPNIRNNLHGEGDTITFSPDSKRVAVAHGRAIRQWEVATGQEIGPTPYLETIHAVAVAKNARSIAACSSKRVQVWDAAAGKVVLDAAAWPDADKQQVALTAVALSADGQRLAVGGSDGGVVLLHVPTGKRLSQLRFHDAPLTSLVFRVDGKQLVSADINNQTALWNAASGEQIRKFVLPPRGGNGKPYRMNFESSYFYFTRSTGPTLSPDGRQLLLSSQTTIELWNLNESPARQAVFKQPHHGKFAVSDDGRLLVIGPNWDESYYIAHDSALYMIDVATGKEMRIVANFPRMRDFSISPDGKLLAACSTDGLRLWDTATGTLQAALVGHRGVVTTVAFSPDGGTLVSAAYDGTVLLWDVATLLARPEPKALAAGELQSLWDDLAAADAQTAGRAMRRLASHPQQAAALLGQKLKPASASKEMLAKLVADLDDARLPIREMATRKLKGMAEMAEPALRACLAANPPLEQRRRVELVLDSMSEPMSDPSKLRVLRSVEVLTVIGTPEAIELLRTLAAGADAYETRDARAALRRMKP